MRPEKIHALLSDVKNGILSVSDACEKHRKLPFEYMKFVKIDNHRHLRTGYPEVIYCPGKTDAQIAAIMKKMLGSGNNILATRASAATYKKIKSTVKGALYNEQARIIYIDKKPVRINKGQITVITAGTSDIPVAEEAAFTAEKMGNKVIRIFDVGVAGIHRLFMNMEPVMASNVLVVAAGMEGALASVVGGLVDKPVIAVPTSVGYGANFGGIAPLLTMLNSCANGVSVVNIDNGFGAGYMASIINTLASEGNK